MPRLIWVFAQCTCHFVGLVMRRLIVIIVSFIGQIIKPCMGSASGKPICNRISILMFVCLRFCDPVNTIVLTSWSVTLLTLFLGRFRLPKRLLNQYLVHVLSKVTDNWISGRGRMVVEIISWPISTKVMWPGWQLNLPRSTLPTALRRPATVNVLYKSETILKTQFILFWWSLSRTSHTRS